ncbi:class I SAM-dependent methyltransferase [Bradyrhizobium sp. U87765 SZCCT0131]|uniref:O-methyltransferase n=1 Tax=unclassified Bradyrhizobium TaxID=2631580 RepID=UPI001BA7D6AF|nr:class I SAM-dependent methyltransferase [Bradyrhizobium sp. U87765 SZCCT0131]MBR1262682.1 class I SAM-dependent methyltransferase [Bradyrhizobium sp. U87765 SZCCT0134]MBR1308846.1 class I SAM-dependent methyltransferase [Bradyrhizobium sp. U87765 SZCCT0110]MBR1318464.1 class I SAM-dependent methyltransferase [Bradyrhizobium sp. U87765 SZCCT0109]MBR1352168.1 class I SAM-dependent methyltransferase [Bradyrhizobium sp. U87765 SZCCT0048]
MDSLSSGLVADILARLHREAEAADASLAPSGAGKAASLDAMVDEFVAAEKRDFQEVYSGLADNFLNVSPQFGRFLYMCARACRAQRIVEFGSSMGVSAIYMAAALRDMGGGRLTGTELEPGKAERARANIAAAGLADVVELRVGDARDTLAAGVGGTIDMVMLDGAFTLYLPVLKLLEPHLRPGALIVGENAFARASGYLDHVRNPQNGYLSLPLPFDLGRGNELTVRTR